MSQMVVVFTGRWRNSSYVHIDQKPHTFTVDFDIAFGHHQFHSLIASSSIEKERVWWCGDSQEQNHTHFASIIVYCRHGRGRRSNVMTNENNKIAMETGRLMSLNSIEVCIFSYRMQCNTTTKCQSTNSVPNDGLLWVTSNMRLLCAYADARVRLCACEYGYNFNTLCRVNYCIIKINWVESFYLCTSTTNQPTNRSVVDVKILENWLETVIACETPHTQTKIIHI